MKLRISNHKVNIETGRYDKISRCARICPQAVCGINIEDKIHLTFCLIVQNIHQLETTFFGKIGNRIPNYKHIPISTFIIQLIVNSTDHCYYLNNN